MAYDHLLVEPLKKYGWEVDYIPWQDKDVNWNRFDAVIVRSPWNYHHAPEPFMSVLETIDASTAHLENSLNLIRWNLNKQYLQDLSDKGIPIVPTKWMPEFSLVHIKSWLNLFDTEKIVIKPIVGAGADGTFRVTRETPDHRLKQMQKKLDDQPVMIQPFMDNIIEEGEFSIFYFNGHYSHTIVKIPRDGDFRVQEEHGGRLKSLPPDPHLKQTGKQIMQVLREVPLYARVDVVRTSNNHFALMELELIEPSLYFNMDDHSPERFAKAFDHKINSVQP